MVYTNHFVLANDFVTRFSNRIMDRRQDQMIAVCNKGKEQLVANGWSADRIQVIFNAVDLDAWRRPQPVHPPRRAGAGRQPLRHAVRLPVCWDKGHKYLIDSVKRLTELCAVPFTLVLPGTGPLAGAYKSPGTGAGAGGLREVYRLPQGHQEPL